MKKLLLLFVGLALSAWLGAQEYRATLLVTVSDPSGAAVPQASVAATNVETGVVIKSQTNAEGRCMIPYLLPGVYRVSVQHTGFKTTERGPVQLRVNDQTRLDLGLELGAVAERVTVEADAPLLETATASRGQVVDHRDITDLPLDGHNPFTLVDLAAGAQFLPVQGSYVGQNRPFDNGGFEQYAINGGRVGINEYQIDGVSNNANMGRNVLAYVPPAEATQAFKIQTNTYDAQFGRTGGGVINVSIKPGTNRFHGAMYEYLRRKQLDANSFVNNATNNQRANHHIDQYGFEIDGPVLLPHIYRGRERTFFMFAFEQHSESLPLPALGTVPTADQKAGDFSKTVNAAGRVYTIYDALTTALNPAYDPTKPITLQNLQYIRQPFAGNRIPRDRMEPIALHVLGDIPLPNQPGDPITGQNNWVASAVTSDSDFRNLIARMDHSISGSWRMYARWNYNFRDGGRVNYYGWDTPAAYKIHAGRRNDGAVLDALGTLSPHIILTLRAGFSRFVQYSVYNPRDVSALGFPKQLVSQLQMPDHYPLFTWEGYLQAGTTEWTTMPSDTFTGQAGITRMAGRHTLKVGAEMRLLHYAAISRVNASGTYNFTRGFSSSTPSITDPNSGDAMASFLLGYMASASAAINAAPYITWRYPVFYFQDDWQVSRRLVLNLGLRWDYETPPVERYNNQNRGFDFTARSPIQVAGLDLKGGLLFAGVNGQPRGAFDPDRNNFQPRLGIAYKMLGSKPLVFRGGIGKFYLPTVEYGGTTGFSQTTTAEVSTVGGLAFRFLSNPFPRGLTQPPGGKLGLSTQAGDAITFYNQQRKIPSVWQFSAGFQYEVIPGLLVEASYVGSRTNQIQAYNSINALTPAQLALGSAYLNQGVANPFYGVLPASTVRGSAATVQRRNLLLPYPQFYTVMEYNLSTGQSWYHALQVRVEQRLRGGLRVLASYTASKTMEALVYLNPYDPRPSRVLAPFDVPQKFSMTGFYELPFGIKKRWANSGISRKLLGGWQVSWSATAQSGPPISYPDYYLNGNPKLEHPTLQRWFNTSSAIWGQRPADTLRTIPLRSPNIRRHTAPQMNSSIIRDFRMTERQKLQLKVSAFNLTNTPMFGFPNTTPTSPLFGTVSVVQINSPRSIEIGVRYAF